MIEQTIFSINLMTDTLKSYSHGFDSKEFGVLALICNFCILKCVYSVDIYVGVGLAGCHFPNV